MEFRAKKDRGRSEVGVRITSCSSSLGGIALQEQSGVLLANGKSKMLTVRMVNIQKVVVKVLFVTRYLVGTEYPGRSVK